MSAEYQDNTSGAYYGKLFSRKDSLEKSFKLYQNPPKDDSVHRGYSPLSDEAFEYFIEYLDTCSTLTYENGYVTYIMTEEFEEFINGAISAQECAERIQSRVSIYLSEQS